MIIHNLYNTTLKFDNLLSDGEYYHLLVNLSSSAEDLPNDIVQKAKKFELKIIFNLSYEGWTHAPKLIYEKFLQPLEIPFESVILLSGSVNVKHDIEIFCQKINRKPFEGHWHLPMEYGTARLAKQNQQQLYHYNTLKFQKRYLKQYNKCFVNFNRRWRYHRPALVGLLKINDLLDKGYVSLSLSDDNITWSNAYSKILELNPGPQFQSIWTAHEKTICNIPNLTLDFPELVTNRAHLDLSVNTYYENSYFSVVSETNYYQSISPAKFFSEKTFKAITFKHPFILVTVPNSLPILRELGYQTFTPYINESYDLENDDTSRLFKIIEEIDRLCNLSYDDRLDFIKNITPIVNHNFNILLNTVIKP